MNFLFFAIIFVFGLAMGSFLNALIYRLNSGEGIVNERSHCIHCGHILSWQELIPLVSFFILGRRCKHCGKPISWQYPLVELATAVAFVLIYNQLLIIDYRLFFQLIFASFLILIFVYDLKHYLILDKVVYPAFALAVIFQIINGQFLDGLLGAVILSGFFALLFFASRGRWIGFGDVKLGLFLGMLVPFPQTAVLFFLAYLIGAVVALTLVFAGKRSMSDKIPFGTFLTFSAFIVMIWGEGILQWYLQLIGY